MTEFANQLQTLSERIVEVIEKNPQDSPAAAPTAWELRLRLKTSLSQLYMALGMLIQEGRIRVVPEGLTYRIRLSPDSLSPSGRGQGEGEPPHPPLPPQGGKGLLYSVTESKALPVTQKT